MRFVYECGGVQQVMDEQSVANMLKTAESVQTCSLSLPARGFARGVVQLSALNLAELDKFCQSKGFNLTIQIDK